MSTSESKVQPSFQMRLTRLEIDIAVREHAERGGLIFGAPDVDTIGADHSEVRAQIAVLPAAVDAAILYVVNARGLAAMGSVKWGVDADGLYCAVEVGPKPRKPRGPNKPKATTPAGGG